MNEQNKVLQLASYTESCDLVVEAAELRKLQEANTAMLEALNEINNWLVCAAIATPEDMSQSFEYMQELAEKAIVKATGKY